MPKGWQPVVLPALDALEEMAADIYACTDHYGTLKFIVRDPTPDAQAIVRMAKRLVNWMCEDCGRIGTLKVSRNGHLKTCCANHPPEVFHHRRDRDNFWDL